MKKHSIIFIVLCITVLIGFVLLVNSNSDAKHEDVYIAVVGPMSGPEKENGKEMLNGIELYLDYIKKSGKHNNIKLLVYDDTNKQAAIKIASEIADKTNVLMVLGHFNNSSCIAAGSIYKKAGIPAITASASSEEIVANNDWYFRTIAGTDHIKNFIPLYVKNALDQQRVSIIKDAETNSAELASVFEKRSKQLDMTISNKWNFNTDADTLDYDLTNIIGNLKSTKNLGMIFCAMQENEGIKILSSSKYPGTNLLFFGGYSFSTPAFIDIFSRYPKEKQKQGYYSNGVYGVSPFLHYVIDDEVAKEFINLFIKKYNKEPSWIAACYCDATRIGLKAIEKSEIKGIDIREDRKKVKGALMRFNRPEMALKGVTGDIYFDSKAGFHRPLYVGLWYKHKFIPAFLQYSNNQAFEPNASEKKLQNDEMWIKSKDEIVIKDRIFTKTDVIYSGMDINDIFNMNIANKTYTVDFYIWFRFQGDFNPQDIIFPNALNPIDIGKPIWEINNYGLITKLYRVVGDFKIIYENDLKYPFIKPILEISFRHKTQPREKLIFIKDVHGIPYSNQNADSIKKINEWKIKSIGFDNTVLQVDEINKKKVSYSLFKLSIKLEVRYIVSFFVKNYFPIAMIFIILLCINLIPYKLILLKMILIFMILSMTFEIQHVRYETIKLNNVFYLIYIVGFLSIAVSGIIYIIRTRTK